MSITVRVPGKGSRGSGPTTEEHRGTGCAGDGREPGCLRALGASTEHELSGQLAGGITGRQGAVGARTGVPSGWRGARWVPQCRAALELGPAEVTGQRGRGRLLTGKYKSHLIWLWCALPYIQLGEKMDHVSGTERFTELSFCGCKSPCPPRCKAPVPPGVRGDARRLLTPSSARALGPAR